MADRSCIQVQCIFKAKQHSSRHVSGAMTNDHKGSAGSSENDKAIREIVKLMEKRRLGRKKVRESDSNEVKQLIG